MKCAWAISPELAAELGADLLAEVGALPVHRPRLCAVCGAQEAPGEAIPSAVVSTTDPGGGLVVQQFLGHDDPSQPSRSSACRATYTVQPTPRR